MPSSNHAPRPIAPATAAATLVAIAAAFALPAAPAAAQEGGQSAQQDMQGGGMTEERQLDDEAARQHFRVATRYYDEGRFLDAAQQFEEAYELSGRPELLYNAYIAYREANQSRRAANALSAYLEAVPDAPDHQNLSARLEQLRIAVEQEEAREQRLSEAEQRAADEAERARQEARARQQAEAAPEAWPWVVLGVGGAALIAGAITGGLALAQASDLRAECDDAGRCPGTVALDDRRDEATRVAIAADALLFGGAAVAATGLILGLVYGLGGGGGDDQETLEASFGCVGTGCAGSIRGRF